MGGWRPTTLAQCDSKCYAVSAPLATSVRRATGARLGARPPQPRRRSRYRSRRRSQRGRFAAAPARPSAAAPPRPRLGARPHLGPPRRAAARRGRARARLHQRQPCRLCAPPPLSGGLGGVSHAQPLPQLRPVLPRTHMPPTRRCGESVSAARGCPLPVRGGCHAVCRVSAV